MNSSESAEAIVKMAIEGTEVLLRISGQGAIRLAAYFHALQKDKVKIKKGKASLNTMLKSGSPLNIFTLKKEDLKVFNQEAKRYGVLYTLLKNTNDNDINGIVDIMVRGEDAAKINRIIEKLKLSVVDTNEIKTEVERDIQEEMSNEVKDKGVQVKSDVEKLADDILSKPIQKEENEMSNPDLAKTEKSPQSEPSLENKKTSGVVSKKKRPSVRKALREIIEEQKLKETKDEVKEEVKDVKHVVPSKKKSKGKVK